MTETALVGYDGSETGRAALAYVGSRRSVSHALLHEAHRPVVVVPKPTTV